MSITLRQLNYLQAVAETGHFGRAAERCAVSQPALSVQIRQLEDVLGVRLFERRAHGAVLTSYGAEVLKRSSDILMQVHDLVDYARQAQEPLSGELRLGIIPTIAPYLLPHLLPVLRHDYPQLQLRLRESQTATIVDQLAKGQLDVALCALPLDTSDLEELPLFEDEFYLAVPKDHRLADQDELRIAALSRERILLLEEGHCFRDQALSFCAQADRSLIDEFGATSFATIMQMVASGFGHTLIPQLAASAEAERYSDLRLKRFAAPRPYRTLGLCWRKSSPRSQDFTLLGDAMASLLKQLAQS